MTPIKKEGATLDRYNCIGIKLAWLILSLPLFGHSAFAQFALMQRSEPAGIFSTSTQYFDSNSSVTTQTIQERSSGYVFTHWEVNGTRRITDHNVSVMQVTFNLLENTNAVAFYTLENQDSDMDQVPDWYEIRMNQGLHANALSNDDNDSLTLAEEVKFNLSSRIEDYFLEGGISIRRSAKTFVNLGGARKLSLSSDPPGLLTTEVTYPEVNSTFTSSNLSGLQSGYAFSHWEVNGVRKQDTIGMGLSKITETMSEDKQIVAKYYDQTIDSDMDGLPDWVEWKEFGNLDKNSNSNTDNDDFTISEERKFGLSDLVSDSIIEGGISVRRSQKVLLNLGGASQLILSSNPPGILPTQKTLHDINSTYTSTNLNGAQSGFVFSHWEINGVRQSDSLGSGLTKVVEKLDSDKTIEAIYIKDDLDSDQDGILDWFEWHKFGTLNNQPNNDADADGFTLLEETKFGTNPLIPDTIVEGGISFRRTLRFAFAQGAPGQNDSFDSDGDGLTDLQEIAIGSNKNIQDTDGDGYSDHAEWLAQSDLLNVNSFPNQPPTAIDLNNSQIFENRPSGSSVGRFTVSDPNQNSTHTVTLVDGNGSTHNSLFHIDANNTLKTNVTFDFETNATQLSIRVKAQDQHNASLTKAFQIQIINVVEDYDIDGIEDHFDPDDDNDGFSDQTEIAYGSDPRDANSIANTPPQAIDLNNTGLFENLPPGTRIGKFSILDPDPNATHSLFFLPGNNLDNQLFNIDQNGTLTTRVTFDFETNSSNYTFQIQAIDEHNGTLAQKFTLPLLNVIEDLDQDNLEDYYDSDDDNDGFSDLTEIAYGSDPRDANSIANTPPQAIDLNNTGLFENLPPGTRIGKFSILDPDLNATHTLSFLSGKGINNSLFNIDQNGSLFTRIKFDFETNASVYTLQVQVTDEHNGSLAQKFALPLLNIVEDLDQDNIEDYYDSDDDNDGFSDITEIAYGSDPRDANSIANAPPQLIELNNTSLLENLPPGTPIGKFYIIDPDPNSTISLNFLADEDVSNQLFKIDQNGTLSTRTVFDFETNSTAYTIHVKATDQHNGFLSQKFIIPLINIVEDFDQDGIEDFFDADDDNDGFTDKYEITYGADPRDKSSLPNLPPTSIELSNKSFLETVPRGFKVGSLSAIDPDINATHIFSFIDGNGSIHNNLFKIDQNNSLTTSALFRYQEEANSFSIRIRATDEHNASLDSSFSIKLIKDPGQHPQLGSTIATINPNGRVSFSTPLYLDNNISQAKLKPTFNEWVQNGEKIPEDLVFIGGSPWFNEETGENRSSSEVYNMIFGDSNTTLPVFNYLISQNERFSKVVYSTSALLDNGDLKASTFNLDENSTYFARVETVYDDKVIISHSVSFITPSSRVEWWNSLQETNNAGWRESDWFGTFLPHKSGWIYHQSIGWLYAHPGKEDDFWLWSREFKWIWTKKGIYPFLFRNNSSNWLYILGIKDGKAVFHDYSTDSIE